MKIPDTELMAEKLGIIVLCENCRLRIKKIEKFSGYYWAHENNGAQVCLQTTSLTNFSIVAKPRKESYAD